MNPIRSCIGCRKTGSPSSLLRMVLVDGKVIFDQQQIAPGRGAWVHRKCFKLAVDRQALKWAFRLSTMPDVTDLQKELLTEMDAKVMKLK